MVATSHVVLKNSQIAGKTRGQEGVKKSVFCLQIENLSWRCLRYCCE